MGHEISGRLEHILLARGNRVMLGTGVVSVRRDGDDLAVRLAGGRELRPDALVFAAARSVITAGLGLENAGVRVEERGRIVVDAERRTSCPAVFAAGDVIGPSLASVAIDQGREACAGRSGSTSRRMSIRSRLPRCTACPRWPGQARARKSAAPRRSRM